MKKKFNFKAILAVLLLLTSFILISCQSNTNHESNFNNNADPNNIERTNYNVSEKDYFDVDGNLLVPFDIAYSNAFNNGAAAYDEKTVLLKVEGHELVLSKELKEAGIESLELSTKHDKTSWFTATIKEGLDVKNVMPKVRKLDNILIADYNYIYETANNGDYEEVITEVINNPKFSEQVSLDNYGIYDAWKWLAENDYSQGGDSSIVVAVIDTGVDYNHVDLKNNIWVNTQEIPGNGIDDDGNGYIDDIHGIDTTDNSRYKINGAYRAGDPMDDHGHGTHVAGIIAASNNQEGIVGIAHNVKIMVVKAGMASGYFTQNAIAEAILYAHDNGADVINMSFGGSAVSIQTQDALMTAYTRTILVASAGNDGVPNEPIAGWFGDVIPNYPAALPYVVGVMSVDNNGFQSSFSNWDSFAFNSIEYEMYAPGEQIISTLPNDRYAAWSGTSMSAPFVSAVAALLRGVYSDRDIYTNKFIMGQLNATSDVNAVDPYIPNYHPPHNVPMIIDAYKALTVLPKPEVNMYDFYLFDSVHLDEKNNGDGIIDAGEVIDIGLVLRNRWGMSSDTVINIDSISTGGVENPYIEFLIDEVNFNSIGTYSTKDQLKRDGQIVVGVDNPLRIKISPDIPNDYIVRINVTGSYKNALDENDENIYKIDTSFEFNVRKGYILPNIISEDMVLTKENYYIIPNSMVIQEGATVNVEPGTQIQFWSGDPYDAYADTAITYLRVEGNFIVQGSLEEPVRMFPSDLMSQYRVEIFERGNGYVSFEYVEITNAELDISYANYTKFMKNYMLPLYSRYLNEGIVENTIYDSNYYRIDLAENSVFYSLGVNKNYGSYPSPTLSGAFVSNIFVNSSVNMDQNNIYLEDNVFLGNNLNPYNEKSNLSITLREFKIYDISVTNYDDLSGKTILRFNMDNYYRETRTENVINLYYKKIAENFGGNFLYAEGNYVYIEIPGTIYLNQIILDQKEISIDNESFYQIVPTLNPTTVPLNSLHYHSSDETIATVDSNGLVTPVENGEATIYVYSNDYQVKEELKVNVVKKIPLEAINVVKDRIQVSINETQKLNVNLKPTNTTELLLNYYSNDENIVTVDTKGYIEGRSVGETIVIITDITGLISKEISVVVVNPVSSLDFEESIYVTTLDQNDDDFLPAITPFDATNQTLIWESSNPEVAYVLNGELIKLKEGVTTLRVNVENTDLFAELVVSVNNDYNPSRVVKMKTYNNYYVALYGDGNIYYWGNGVSAPKKMPIPYEGPIKDFGFIGNRIFILKADGTMKEYQISSINSNIYETNTYNVNVVDNIVAIESDGSSLYMIQDNKNVWAVGNNDYGQLGDGTNTRRNYPVQVLINDVVKSQTTGDLTGFLTSNGELYLTGGYNTKYLKPTKVLSNVLDINSYNSNYINANQMSQIITYYRGNQNNQITTDKMYSRAYYDHYYIENGQLFFKGNNNYGKYGLGVDNSVTNYSKVLKVENVSEIFIFNYNVFIQTTDNKFYGSGQNTSYQLGNLSNQNANVPQRIFFGLEGNDDNLDHLSTNLIDNYLYEDVLNFKFSEALLSSDQYGTINLKNSKNQILSVIKTINLNMFEIRPFSGWVIGETYTITIPNNALVSKFMVSNQEISYTFTYMGSQTEIELLESNLINKMKFNRNNVAFNINYSYALAGDLFDDIKIINVDTLEEVRLGFNLDNSSLTFSDVLPFGNYELVIPEGALQDNVDGVNEAVNVLFSVVEEIYLENTTHENNADRLMVDDALVFNFNVALEGELFNEIKLLDINGIQVETSVILENNTLTITPINNLDEATLYTINIPKGALVDEIGNLNEVISNTFKTYEALELIKTSINDNEENVALNQSIILTFNYALEGETFNNIKVVDKDLNEALIEKEIIGRTLVIRPVDGFVSNSNYQVIVPSGVLEDEFGVTNDEIILNFKTISKMDRFYWNEETITAKWNEIVESGYNTSFTGNAILNNFNNLNVEEWLRIQAVTSETYNHTVGISGNYWGTTDEFMIGKQIIDFNDYQSLLHLVLGDYLLEAPENTFPFVVDIEIFNEQGEKVTVVGNELITIRVHFNRDMNQDIPLTLKFGSSLPYGEREVRGEYITPRTWEGTYQLTTIIENGNQYFFINNGAALDNAFFTLQPDYGRFRFEIDTTSAQAMIMQAESTYQGVKLTWFQDDFDTLAGFNLYRSTSLNGQYNRLNSSVITVDQTEYLDDTVEPGVIYYYNFTVVKTDLSESEPSGRVDVRAFDSMAPNIYHTPIYQAFTNNNLVISATILDNVQIISAKVYYRIKGQSNWNVGSMTSNNDRYSAIINSSYLTLEGLEYYIESYDGINYTYRGTSSNPIETVVQKSVDSSSLGDVNGDGLINVLDALLILQAINGRVNLNAEEFFKSDLDGNGILEAWEALRVMQYANGNVTTIN